MKFVTDVDVELVDSMGGDLRVCQAARVSTKGADSYGTGESEGLINFLMSNRHGSPFEHATFTWLITAPIFVWREFMRHRIASYNEESGRYKQLEPVFYVPSYHRNLIQVGKTGAYSFEPGTDEQYDQVLAVLQDTCAVAYEGYTELLDAGIAKEVARMALPLNIMSSAYVTMNMRALMNFLSLRTKDESAAHTSYPQHEIELVARKMEQSLAEVAPLCYASFNKNGRQQP